MLGLDGLDPVIVESLLARGELPNLARLRAAGGYGRVATTLPAQTPVAWSTFATGTNPGGHGIFDFVRRDPATYLPDLSLNRYEQKNAFLPPRAVNLRGGTPLWEDLATAGVRSVVIRCPCTFPPDATRGRMLAGMGVPDLRGGLGTSTFYSTDPTATAGESEQLVRLTSGDRQFRTHLIGPRHPKTRENIEAPITLDVDRAAGQLLVRSEGTPAAMTLCARKWSDWLRIRFKTGVLQAVHGMVRFYLVRTEPEVELYCSPINFDPNATLLYPISAPPEYARELTDRVGLYHTTGMVEDHGGLNNGRFDEAAYLDQCAQVMRERERMLTFELERLESGFLYCLFDTPDRLQHMFWRFRETDHPANRGTAPGQWQDAIEDHYRECDAVVGRMLAHADDQTLVIVLSDHGFGSFQRGFHLNTWLNDEGLLALKPGHAPGHDAGELFQSVDWSRTQAYALGLGSIYLNVRGREAQGIVAPDDADALGERIAGALRGVPDPARGTVAVVGGSTRAAAYRGPFAAGSPDVVARFARGYRVSWSTALGGIPSGHFEDNCKRWSGDHIVDPEQVPGVLFMNRPFRSAGARLLDLAPTILAAFGVPKGTAMEGESLFA